MDCSVLCCEDPTCSVENLACRTKLKREVFGRVETPGWGFKDIIKITMRNCKGSVVELINYGASLVSIKVPDINGNIEDVLLGFDSFEDYSSEKNPYFGATVGRVANRIANASYCDPLGRVYQLDKNDGKNTLHGGFEGLSKVVWADRVDDTNGYAQLTYSSSSGESGFPCLAVFTSTFILSANNNLRIYHEGVCHCDICPFALTNHAYFNLAGHGSGRAGLNEHFVQICSHSYTPVDENLIPTGEFKNSVGTPFNFENVVSVGNAIENKTKGAGYDVNLVLGCRGILSCAHLRPPFNICTNEDVIFAARVFHPSSGRHLTTFTNQPGMQFYTARNLERTVGKNSAIYEKNGAFCLETQNYPDAIHRQGSFPKIFYTRDEKYRHYTEYKFDVKTREEIVDLLQCEEQ